MKETSFIDQNKEKWARFERIYASKVNEPEELSDLYMDITDDLSYAQTFYKRRTVRVYLNQLAQMVYSGVHKQKGKSLSNFLTVWKKSLPLEIYRARKHLFFALIAFLVYVFIGVLTTHLDPDFPRTVLGDGYVDMTLKNIENGNPLAVYEDDDQLQMFIRITTNNLKVSFLTFFVGFFFTFGTHILMFQNGVMLGAFQYLFHLKGLLVTSFLGIWIHGAFEISCIVLAAGAGITAGNGWLFPKSYTRMQSLQLSTRRGLKIMLSLVPFIIVAGFLESYITANYMDLPDWSKWMLILLSFAIILVVYLFYPLYVARKYPEEVDQEEVGFFAEKKQFVLTKISTLSEIITDSFQFFRFHFSKFGKVIFQLIVPIIILLVVLQDLNHIKDLNKEHWYDWASQLELMIGYGFSNKQDIIITICWSLVFTLFYVTLFWSVKTRNENFSWISFFRFLKQKFAGIWIGNLLLYSLILLLPWYLLLPALLLLPFFMLQGATMAFSDLPFKKRLSHSFRIGKNTYSKSLLILLLTLSFAALAVQPIAFVFSLLVNDVPLVRDLLDMTSEFIQRVAIKYTDTPVIWSNIVRQAFYLLYLLILVPLAILPSAFSYFSEVEKTEVQGLRKQFEKFGKRSRFKENDIDFE